MVVGILLIVLFGAISLVRLPLQLTPDVTQPTITVSTGWRAAAPEEMEAEIIERQEDVLKGLQGLESMVSSAQQGRASITLRYRSGLNMDRALLDLVGALNQVPSYPPDATEPRIAVAGNSAFTAIAWFALRPLPGNDNEISGYLDYVEEVVQPKMERVPGVSQTNAFGGRSYEVRITFDPYRAAALQLKLPEVAATVGGNSDVSGGFSDVGRRKYTLRFAGDYEAEGLSDMILDWRNGSPIYLKDVATVEVTLQDRFGTLSLDGQPAIAINAQAEQGVNVIDVMKGLQQSVADLNRGPLAQAGLTIIQMYDETTYIGRSMSLVRNNLLLGILLAITVLWWFLRRFTATLAVAVAIPISLTVTFVALDVSGRSLNIISMAGLAFAVGMVLDAAIVVLENIVRLREKGKGPRSAALEGASQVWGALLASTITTVAIFLPIAFLDDVAGQLFADLAIAIAVAVVASMLVAVTVLPAAATRLLSGEGPADPHARWWQAVTRRIMILTNSPSKRAAWVIGLMGASITGSYLLFPDADYLPKGNQNSFRAFIQPPPGISVTSSRNEMVDVINSRIKDYLSGEKQPQIAHTWMGVFGSFGFMGGRAVDPDRLKELVNVVNREILAGFPDTLSFAKQSSLFRGLGGGRVIDIDIQATDTDRILEAALAGYGAVQSALPGARTQPVPGLVLAEPELRLIPDERRLAEAGWTRKQMSAISRSLGDGLYVGDYFDGTRRLNVFLRAEEWRSPEELAAYPLYTPEAGIQSVGELAKLERTAGPSSIRRVDRHRTITLRVTPPDDISLEAAVAQLERDALPTILSRLPPDGSVQLRGTAEQLGLAVKNMSRSFLLAITILLLLIAALFRSFKDALLVILTIPLATIGGISLLRITDAVIFQPLDLLTMIGFIILLGLVVNNAILLVHQTRSAERQGLGRIEAVEQAVRRRLRPILMSTLTSICGMLPLLLVPGAGAELYRGIAAVIVGGMAVSTLFTLIFLPSLLQMGRAQSREALDEL